MANMVLASPEVGDNGTITGSAVAAGLPLDNLKTQPIGQVTRFTTPGGCSITYDLGSAQSVNLVALLGHNASTTGTVQVLAADTEAELSSNPVYDSGSLRLRSNIFSPSFTDFGSLEKNHFIHTLTATSARWWKFEMADASLSYLDIGRAYVSNAFQPEYNLAYGYEEGHVDPSDVREAKSGRLYVNERDGRRYADFVLDFLSKEEAFGGLFDITHNRGRKRDVLFVTDPEDLAYIQKRSIYGLLSELRGAGSPFFQTHEKSHRITEIIR